jgi:two-component system chemotaxis response regulator CheY
VVDDEVPVRRVARRILEYLGYAVAEAGNGVEGLEKVTEFRPDVVLLDMRMPEKDGLEMLREMRALDHTMAIVAMTGGDRADAEICLRVASHLGAPLLLLKPFTTDELGAVVELARTRAADSESR